MTDKKKHSTSRSIWKFLELVPCFLRLFRGVLHKIKVETFFTIKNILLLFMIGLMLACLVTATWVSLLGILFFSLLKLQWSWYAAAGLVMFVNVIGFLVLGICMTRVKNRLMSVEALRELRRRE